MKIVIPTLENKLCSHFGHCESFTFVEVDENKKEIIKIETKIPEDGVSCQSAGWIAENGADVVLAGGMGGRPLNVLLENGVSVVPGCPELEIKDIVLAFLNETLSCGENSCGGEHSHCGGHKEGHHNCHHH